MAKGKVAVLCLVALAAFASAQTTQQATTLPDVYSNMVAAVLFDGAQQITIDHMGTLNNSAVQYQILQDVEGDTETMQLAALHLKDTFPDLGIFPVIFGTIQYKELSGMKGFQLNSVEKQSEHDWQVGEWIDEGAASRTRVNGEVVATHLSRTVQVNESMFTFTSDIQNNDTSRLPPGATQNVTILRGDMRLQFQRQNLNPPTDTTTKPCLQVVFVSTNATMTYNGVNEIVATSNTTSSEKLFFRWDVNYLDANNQTQPMSPSVNILLEEDSGQPDNTFAPVFFCFEDNGDFHWEAQVGFRVTN